MQRLLYVLCCLLIIGCSNETEDETEVSLHRTILVYISGENNLSSSIQFDIKEMREGSVGIGANALVVYVDENNSSRQPYIICIRDGETTDSMSFDSDGISSDPSVMKKVLNYTSEHYPAEEYGLVLWGHASGWIIEDSVTTARSARKGYGIDNGRNNGTNIGKWINMNTMARILTEWGHPLKFILADCCQFQCIESAYELRNTTEYIIGSPAEIPGVGAPYNTITKAMFSTADDFYREVTDAYFAQTSEGYRVPLSVIRTSELEQLAKATETALKVFAVPAEQCPDLTNQHLIYYKGPGVNAVMYDMNDFMLMNAPETIYSSWKEALDKVVVNKTFTARWMTFKQIDFNQFEMTEERYGGVSMFIPQQRSFSNYSKYNQDIRKTAWYWAAHLNEIGW